MRHLDAESRAAWSERTALSVTMVMIDGYEELVDANGHKTVDRILFEIARLIEGDLRTRDFVGRLSDDTFGAILPETTAGTANTLAVRLRAAELRKAKERGRYDTREEKEARVERHRLEEARRRKKAPHFLKRPPMGQKSRFMPARM